MEQSFDESVTAGRRTPALVVSRDDAYRETIREAVGRSDGPMEVALEVDAPFDEAAASFLERLPGTTRAIVFLDLDENPERGLEFAEHLRDNHPGHTLVASGAKAESDLLLRVMHAGVGEFLPKPLSVQAVVEAVGRISRRHAPPTGADRTRTRARIISVFGVKGGTGSTALSVNVAVALHRATGGRTVLVDLDVGQGEAAMMAGLEPRYSVLDALKNVHRMDADMLTSLIETAPSGIDVLAAPHQPADYEPVSGVKVGQLLRLMRQHYDWVVVDLPGAFNPTIFAALEQTDRLLLVTTADLPALRNVTRFLPLLRNTIRRPPETWLQLILNRYNPKDTITPPEIEKALGVKIDWTVRNDYRTVMNSINTGEPAVTAGDGPYVRDIEALARKLSGREPPRKKGSLRGLSLFGNHSRRRTAGVSTESTGEHHG